MDSGWVVVVQLDFSLNSAPFCFWTQTLRVEFGDLSRNEQEPGLTIVLTLTLPSSNIVTVIEFMVSNPQHILHTTYSSSHITSKSTINLCIWHLWLESCILWNLLPGLKQCIQKFYLWPMQWHRIKEGFKTKITKLF